MKKHLKRFWRFIWEEDSLASWVVTALLAFILIKFLIYPGLGLILGTSHPIVAVVSGSMEHKATSICLDQNKWGDCIEFKQGTYGICGFETSIKGFVDLDTFYEICGDWYEERGILQEQFATFRFKNGFNTGDIMLLWRKDNIKVGDIIVFNSNTRFDPIIHRVVEIKDIPEGKVYKTKGDHNHVPGANEENIAHSDVIGKAVVRIPLLGYVKILFVKMINMITRVVS